MTVAKLIKELEKMPQDAEVIYYDSANGYTTPSNIVYGKFSASRYHDFNYVECVDITGE